MKLFLRLCGNVVASLVFATLFASITFASYSFFEAIRNHSQEEKYQPILRSPPDCDHLRREPDPATWDSETDTYPRNHAWEKCMGVG